ncbi:MAG: DUF262 domain-containing protein [Alistipes sp.]|nr:DUF262 domain-containing protein [Alistipes sp.]
MQQTITPDKQTVEACLKSKSYYIDFYQREYVWSKETVEILLRDIFYSFEISYEQFKDAELSPAVIEKFNWYYLNIYITNNIGGKIYVVDGQQRLSTLTLIANKLYHITTDDDLKESLKSCIYGKDKWKGNIFLLDHDKRHEIMERILKEDIATAPTFKNKTEETLWNRYKDISKFIDDKEMDEKMVNTFIYYFLERLVLVELTIQQNDTPMIFEVINDRGEALKPFEILKGKLVGALDKLDTDKYSKLWDDVIAQLFKIEDEFFADYLKSRFIFKRNSKVEGAVNNTYHRYIFEGNDIAQALGFRRTDKKQIANIKRFIESDMVYYGRLYSKIRSNELNDEFMTYNSSIHGLAGQYYIILSACEINDQQEDEKIRAITKEYDRIYMLLRLNGAYDSNSFQDIAYQINEQIRGRDIAEYRDIFNNILREAISERKGGGNLSSLLDYNTFKQVGYANMEKRSLRYFLARVEKFVCDGLGQSMKDSVETISTKTSYKLGYHIEHILSHNQTNIEYFNDEEEFELLRNQLGGLLLLKDRDNISSGNEEYSDKLKTYSAGLVWGHTLCKDYHHTNKSLESFNNQLQERCGEKIAPIDFFDKAALESRTKLLYEIVKLIWEI